MYEVKTAIIYIQRIDALINNFEIQCSLNGINYFDMAPEIWKREVRIDVHRGN
jgi:hypothetical protein